jgi:hypothetical protein
MRLIIAGSRTMEPTSIQVMYTIRRHRISMLRDAGATDSVYLVLCGCADGVDRSGFTWARMNGIEVEFFPAWPSQQQWARKVALPGEKIHQIPLAHGKSSGMIRNVAMAEFADALLVFWDGKSPGTAGMIKVAERGGLKVFVERTIHAA